MFKINDLVRTSCGFVGYIRGFLPNDFVHVVLGNSDRVVSITQLTKI